MNQIITTRKLAKPVFILIAICVAALFIGSAAAAGIDRTLAPSNTNIQSRDHNIGIVAIDTPQTGNAGIITPTVTVINHGTSDEVNVPLNLLIGSRQVSGTTEDFEATNGGYTASGTPSIVWEWGTPTSGPGAAHSGVKLWATDLDANYPAYTNAKLDSSSFVVPAYAELTFWHWYDTEGYYDGGNVKISTDGGSTWSIIYPSEGYPEDAAASTNAGIPGEPCFSGHIQGFWQLETFDLTAYGGQTAKIRFHFGSDGSIQYPGWYIDDVTINAITWLNEYNQTQTFDIAAGDTMQITLPAWTPVDLNVQEDVTVDYNAEASVTLAGDTDPTDNFLAKPFSLYYGYFHDVAVTQIVAPTTGLAAPVNPEVVVENIGQNSQSVDVSVAIEKASYTLYVEEYFEGDFPPAGWTNQIIQNHGWVRNDQTTDQRPNYAGGEGYCADADSDDVGSGGPWPMECALISPSMDLTSVNGAVLTCTEAFDSLGGDYADVDISTDGGTTWTNLQHWTDDHSPSGPGENVQFDLSSYCGNADVKIRFLYFADGWDWYYEVDNVKVYTIAFSPEYDASMTVDIDAGEAMYIVFPDVWTPSDMAVLGTIDYRVTATATLVDGDTDENPVNNELVQWITLTYSHDAGVTEIKEPSGGTLPPGTYPVEGTVENLGVTFPESNIPVEAKITHIDNSTVIYDEFTTVPGPLAPGESATVTFPTFTLENLTAWEGKYKVEIMTALPNDDHPENDKKSITFTMAITDVIAPITDHSMTGTMGQNGWYVSNVVITLTATDPAPPINDPLPPSGVNHTYYKLHSADAWTEYTSIVTVTTDGLYELFYYSVDKAGNSEAAKGPFAFKIDKTVPVFDSFTATAMNTMKNKWLLNATITDTASGVGIVEFYIDDQLVGNVTAPNSDGSWSFVYQGKGKVAQAIVYDNAGNSAMSPQVQDLALIFSSQPVQSLNGMLSVRQTLQLK